MHIIQLNNNVKSVSNLTEMPTEITKLHLEGLVKEVSPQQAPQRQQRQHLSHMQWEKGPKGRRHHIIGQLTIWYRTDLLIRW